MQAWCFCTQVMWKSSGMRKWSVPTQLKLWQSWSKVEFRSCQPMKRNSAAAWPEAFNIVFCLHNHIQYLLPCRGTLSNVAGSELMRWHARTPYSLKSPSRASCPVQVARQISWWQSDDYCGFQKIPPTLPITCPLLTQASKVAEGSSEK